MGLCFAYVIICARGIRTALKAPDDFGGYLAFGISTLFAVPAVVNLAVALAILPTKGLTLPFVSFGGSSLLVNAAAAGIPPRLRWPPPNEVGKTQDATRERPR